MTLVLNITNSNGETERLSLSLNGTYAIPEGSVIDVESISGLTDLQWQNGRLTLTFTDGIVVLEGITVEQLEALAPAMGDIQTSALGNDGETDGGSLDLARLFSGASQTGGRSSVNSFEMGIETGLGGTEDGQGQQTITPSAPQQNETQTTTNSAPLAQAISGLASENGSAISLSALYTDADTADTHSFSIDTTGTAGLVTHNGDGTFSYETNGAFESLGAGQTATDSFTYTVTDSNGASSTATATVTIEGANDAPVGANGAASGDEDTAITGTVTASDVDGDNLSYALATGGAPAHGSVSFNASQYTYTPDSDFNGSDSFDVEISDGNGGTDIVTIDITVDPVNDAPIAENDAFSGNEDAKITGNVLADNGAGTDRDIDGDALTVTAGTFTTAQGGSVTLLADGSFTYTPTAHFNGTDSFDYTVSDGTETDSGTVSLNIAAVNDLPDTVSVFVSGNEDAASIRFNLLGTDIEGLVVSFRIVTLPSNGTLYADAGLTQVISAGDTVAASGNTAPIYFVPAADTNGRTTFTFAAIDDEGGEDASLATGIIDIRPVGDTATISGTNTGSVTEDGTLTETGSLRVTDPDAGENEVVAQMGTAGNHGSFSITAAGDWTYTLNNADPAVQALETNQTLTETFTVTSKDGTATETVTITINGTHDNVGPVASTQTVTINEDTAYNGTVAATDLESDPLTYALVANSVVGGTVTNFDATTGAFTFTPDPDFAGTASFQFTANDGSLTSAAATVTIDVAPVADGGTMTLGGTGLSASDLLNFSDNPSNNNVGDNNPSVAKLSNGNIAITWDGSRYGDNDVFVRIFDTSGNDLFGEIKVSDDPSDNGVTDNQASVIALSDGRFAVVWQGFQDGNYDIFVRTFDASGTAITSAISISDNPSDNGADDRAPSVTALPNGGLVVTWYAFNNGDTDVFARIVDAAGNASPNIINVSDGPTDNGLGDFTSSVTALSTGGFVVAWQSYRDGDHDVYARTFNAAGDAVSGEINVSDGLSNNSVTDGLPSVTPLSGGNFVVTWDRYHDGDQDIYAKVFNASGTAITGEINVSDDPSNNGANDKFSTVTTLSDGGFVVTWHGAHDGDNDIFARTYDANGNATSDVINVSDDPSDNNHDDYTPSVTALADGGFVVTWYARDGYDDDVFARIFTNSTATEDSNYTIPVGVTLSDSSESVTAIVLSGFPAGATFATGHADGATWVIDTAADISAVLGAGEITLTPPANYSGTFTLTASLTVTDTAVLTTGTATDTTTITETADITFNPVNDAPVGSNGSASGNEDTAIIGTISATDVDGDSLTYSLATGGAPAHGSVSFNGSQYTYTPDADFNGSDSFDVEISDGNGGIDTVTIGITVGSTNDAPILSATGSPSAVDEAGDASAQDIGALTGNLTVSDADTGDTLTASINGAPTLVWSGGTLSATQEATLLAALGTGKLSFDGSVSADGSAQSLGWSWDPAAADLDFLASGDTLTVTYDVAVGDGTQTTATQPLTFTIAGTNDAPVAYMDTGTLTEDDGSKTFNVLGNDILDLDAGALNTVTVGNITLGTNSYGLTASDVQVTVTADNQLTVELLGSGWDAMWNGESLPLTIQYRLNGDNGEFAGNQLSLTVQGRNDAPVLDASVDLSISVSEDAGLPGVDEGTLVSDLVDRVDGSGLDNVTDDSFITGIAITGANTTHGTWYYSTNDGANWTAISSVSDAHALTLSPNARVTFVPDDGYNGTVSDGLTIRAWDGSGGANGSYWDTTNNGGTTGYSAQTDTVSVTIDAVNDAPVLSATGSPAAVNEADDASAQDIGALTGNLTVSDADAGDTLTASINGAPTLVWSGGTLSATQEATLLAALGTGKLSFDGSVSADGSAQSLGWSWDPAAADLDFLANGQTLTVTYDVAVSDGTETTATQPLTFTIAGTNDAPVAYMDTGTLTEDDGSKTFNVLGNDILDLDAGALNTVTVGNITLGTNSYGLTASDVQVTVTADNQLTVELLGSGWDALPNGITIPLTVQYRLNGDNGEFAGNQLSLTVQGRNDAPVLDASVDLSISISEDAGLPGVGEGTLVSDLVDRVDGSGLDNVTDDSFITGIAITDTNTDHGTWYYSTNDGANWTAIASVSDAHALTLSPNARVTFVPDDGYNGTVSDGLTIRAWDGSGGANGSYWDTTNNGGTTGYSAQTDTVSVTIDAVHDAPVLSATGSPSAIDEADDASAQDIGALTGNLTVSDADAGDTVTASVDGAPSLVWSGGTLSAAQEASLLAALGTGKLSFDGSVAADGSAQSLGWSWDPAAADLDFLTAGQTLTVTYQVAVSDGTETTATQPLTFTIAGTNDAPVAYMDTGSMTEDDGSKTFDVLSNDTLDPDAGALNTVTVSNIRLGTNSYGLTASDVQVTVTPDNQLKVELLGSKWDAMWNGQSLGLNIYYRLTGDNGESSSNLLALSVRGLNDAPVLDASVDLSISVLEDATLPAHGAGTLVSELVDPAGYAGGLDNVTDDSFVYGIAITGANTSHGIWYYSVNNGASWTVLGAVSDSNALTLNSSARLAFVPDAGYSGTVADGLTIRAWDISSGANGSYWDTTTNGGTTSYSAQTDTVAITVTSANDAPVLADLGPMTAFTETNANNGGLHLDPYVTVSDSDSADFNGGTLTISGLVSGEDTVYVRNVGTGAGQIGVSGNTVTYGGVAIATFTGGNNGNDLVVSFNANATPAAVETLIEKLNYSNSSDNPSPVHDLVYTLTDGDGGSTSASLRVLIQADNDAATISGDASGSVTEDGTLTDTGTLIVTDPDSGENQVVAQTNTAGTYGTFSITAAGVWTYNLDNANASVQALNSGQHLTETFTVTSKDGTASETVTITINGADDNHAPVASADTLTAETAASISLADLDGTNGFALLGVNAYDDAGGAVSNAGDINGDGFDDIIVSVYNATVNGKAYAGRSYVIFGSDQGYPASQSLSSIDGTNGFALNGFESSARAGYSVSSAGDINGDGFDDILIGAPATDVNGVYNTGATYVIFGSDQAFASSISLNTLNGTDGFVINGVDYTDESGVSVSSAGDINGDGIDDILIGAQYADPNGNNNAGEAYVVFGRTGAYSATFDLSSLNGSNGFVINGIDADDVSGFSVSSAGDVNGDGIDDILIGAPEANGGRGEAYVVFGRSTGFSTSLNLSSLNGSNGFRINGIDTGDNSGFSVSSAGDINGDGIDDILIGAPNADGDTGEAYVVFGKSTGFSAGLNLSSLNGSNGFVLTGFDGGDHAGYSVSSAGDINGDGIDDLLIGATYAQGDTAYAGQTYVVYGTTSGFSSTFDLSLLDGTNGFAINGIGFNDTSGWSVSSAGDINGDGVNDIVIGAYFADVGAQTDAGAAYVVFGQSSNPPANAVTTIDKAALLANDTDADGDTLTVSAVSATSASGAIVTLNGNGTISYDPTGVASFASLGIGETATDTFTYTISDGHGGHDTATVTMTVSGVNDAASISGDTTGSVTEDGTLTETGTLTVTDPDTGENQVIAQTNTAGTYGTFSITTAGDWTYNLDNANSSVQALNSGQNLTETFTVTSKDGSASETVTITINGADDHTVVELDWYGYFGLGVYGASLSSPYIVDGYTYEVDASVDDGDKFTYNAATTYVSFITPPDYYNNNDVGGVPGDGEYEFNINGYDANGVLSEVIHLTFIMPNLTPPVVSGAENDTFSAVPADWVWSPDNAHIYQYDGRNTTWTLANSKASNLISGTSYLATITSAAENTFADALVNLRAFLGASDSATEGLWTWVTGPEAGTQFWSGNYTGSAVGVEYVNWASGQPSTISEDYLQLTPYGEWNDAYYNEVNIGYLAEAGAPGALYAPITAASPFTFEFAWLQANDTNQSATLRSVSATSSLGATLSFNAATGEIVYDPTTSATLQVLGAASSATDTFTYTIYTGAGISTATVELTVQGNNHAPDIDGLAETIIFQKSGSDMLSDFLDPNLAVTDSDSTNFENGVLVISGLIAGEDTVTFLAGAGNPFTITSTESILRYNSQSIGYVALDEDQSQFVVVFGSGATAERVTALLEHLQITNNASNPTLHRALDITLTDGDGGAYHSTIDVQILGQGSSLPAGTAGDDMFVVQNSTVSGLDGGTGHDTLHLGGSGITLDFTQLSQTAVTSVEEVDLTGTGNNALVVSLQDVLDMSDETSGNTTTLTVNGDAGDTVGLSGAGWTQGADTQINGTDYHVWTNDGGAEIAKLVVQDQVTVQAA